MEPQKSVYLEYSDENTETTSSDSETADTPEPVLRRSDRERRQPNYYGHRCTLADVKEPSCVRDALEKQEWLDAMQTEADSLHSG